jgi:hypothetical protein
VGGFPGGIPARLPDRGLARDADVWNAAKARVKRELNVITFVALREALVEESVRGSLRMRIPGVSVTDITPCPAGEQVVTHGSR